MSKFSFEFNGQKFEINAPTGTTFEQAKAVFSYDAFRYEWMVFALLP